MFVFSGFLSIEIVAAISIILSSVVMILVLYYLRRKSKQIEKIRSEFTFIIDDVARAEEVPITASLGILR